MNLKIYNAENASRKQSSTPTIHLPKKGGLITISKTVAQTIGLAEGSKVSVGQDPKNVKDWYLFEDKNGFTLKSKKASENLSFNSSLIAEDIRACAKPDIDQDKGIKMRIGLEPVKFDKDKTDYYPILTSSARN